MMTLGANILFFISALFMALFLAAATVLAQMSQEEYDRFREQYDRFSRK
jgi:hypothetical protein